MDSQKCLSKYKPSPYPNQSPLTGTAERDRTERRAAHMQSSGFSFICATRLFICATPVCIMCYSCRHCVDTFVDNVDTHCVDTVSVAFRLYRHSQGLQRRYRYPNLSPPLSKSKPLPPYPNLSQGGLRFGYPRYLPR